MEDKLIVSYLIGLIWIFLGGVYEIHISIGTSDKYYRYKVLIPYVFLGSVAALYRTWHEVLCQVIIR
jgi:hypothetical protein